MKTICCFLLIGLGGLTQGVGFAEPAPQAAPRAPAQNTAAVSDHSIPGGNDSRTYGKTDPADAGHSTEKPADGKGSVDARSPASKPEVNHGAAVSNQPRTPDAHRHEPDLHHPATRHPDPQHPKPVGDNQPHPGEKPVGTIQTRTTPVNVAVQGQSGLGKPVAPANNLVVAKKPETAISRPVSPSVPVPAGSLSGKSVPVRNSGLATLGGPAKPVALNNVAVNGPGVKFKP